MADDRGRLYAIDPDAHGRITAWLAGTEIALPGSPVEGERPPPVDGQHAADG